MRSARLAPPDPDAARVLIDRRTTIDELSTISHEVFHRDYVDRNRPFVLRGAAAGWHALRAWRDDAHLDARAGSVEVSYQVADRCAFDPSVETREGLLSDFLRRYRTDRRLYVNDIDLPPSLAVDLGPSPLVELFEGLDATRAAQGFFLGGGAQFSDLHFDDVDLIYIVLDGCKIWHIFGQHELRRVYPRTAPNEAFFSQVRLDDPRPDTFPEFADAERLVAELEPGDALFLPAHYWHAVETVGRSVAVSWVRVDRRSQLHTFVKLLEHDLLPIDGAHRTRLMRMVHAPPGTSSVVDDRSDPFTLYLSLALQHTTLRRAGLDTGRIEHRFAAARGRVRAALGEIVDPTVRDLMGDLYQLDDDDGERGGC